MSLHSQLNKLAIIVCENILLIPQFCVIQCSHQDKVNHALGTFADRLIHAIRRVRAPIQRAVVHFFIEKGFFDTETFSKISMSITNDYILHFFASTIF